MIDAVAPTRSRRLPFGAIIIALVISALGGVFVMLWFKLPTWAPEWVVEHSPWVDPIVRAVETQEGLRSKATPRIKRHGQGLSALLLAYLEADEIARAGSLLVMYDGDLVDNRLIPPLVRVLRNAPEEWDEYFEKFASTLRVQSPALVADAILPLPSGSSYASGHLMLVAGGLADQRAVSELTSIAWENPDALALQDQSEDEEEVKLRTISSEEFLNPKVRRNRLAVRCLVKSPLKDGVSVALRALNDADPRIRIVALEGILFWRDARIDPLLKSAALERLQDPHPSVRRAAAKLMRMVAIPGAEAALLALSQVSSRMDRRAAAFGLGSKWTTEVGIKRLSELLQDHEPFVRQAACLALAESRHSSVIDVLEAAWPSADHELRLQMLEVLRYSQFRADKRVIPFAFRALDFPDDAMRKAADQLLPWLELSEEQQQTWTRLRERNSAQPTGTVGP